MNHRIRSFAVLAVFTALLVAFLAVSCGKDDNRPFDAVKARNTRIAAGIRQAAQDEAADFEAAETERLRLAAEAAERARAAEALQRAVEARKARERASRARTTQRPVIVASAPAPGGCNSWATKSRAQSDACWTGLVTQYQSKAGWSVSWALRIIYCESRGNPYAKNPRSSATGLFQILGGPTDPEANVSLAAGMYARRGSQPWVCK